MSNLIRCKLAALLLLFTAASFQVSHTLKGNWEFVGGIYNGKKEGAPKEYALHRKYNDVRYEAFVLEKGSKPEKYEAGNYILKGDTCLDTETFCSQPSKITKIPIHYLFAVRNDTLILKAKLPSKMQVEEYWKRVR
jgi:hypothetical protein